MPIASARKKSLDLHYAIRYDKQNPKIWKEGDLDGKANIRIRKLPKNADFGSADFGADDDWPCGNGRRTSNQSYS